MNVKHLFWGEGHFLGPVIAFCYSLLLMFHSKNARTDKQMNYRINQPNNNQVLSLGTSTNAFPSFGPRQSSLVPCQKPVKKDFQWWIPCSLSVGFLSLHGDCSDSSNCGRRSCCSGGSSCKDSSLDGKKGSEWDNKKRERSINSRVVVEVVVAVVVQTEILAAAVFSTAAW